MNMSPVKADLHESLHCMQRMSHVGFSDLTYIPLYSGIFGSISGAQRMNPDDFTSHTMIMIREHVLTKKKP